MRVQLPVENVFGGSDVKRVAEDGRSTVQCRTQLYDLWTERNSLIVPVVGPVIQRNLYSHPPSCCPRLQFRARHHLAPQPVYSPNDSQKPGYKDTLAYQLRNHRMNLSWSGQQRTPVEAGAESGEDYRLGQLAGLPAMPFGGRDQH